MTLDSAVVNGGKIEQQGGINDIFFKPSTPFMASFVGMKNIIPVTFRGSKAVTDGDMEISLNKELFGESGHIAISPDSIVISLVNRAGLTSEPDIPHIS